MSDFAYNLNLQPISQEEHDRCMELIAQQTNFIHVLRRVSKNNGSIAALSRVDLSDRQTINQQFNQLFNADSAQGTEPGGN